MTEKRKNDEARTDWAADLFQGYGLLKILGILLVISLLFSAKSAWWLIFPLMWLVWGGKQWRAGCGSPHKRGCDTDEYPDEKRKNEQIV